MSTTTRRSILSLAAASPAALMATAGLAEQAGTPESGLVVHGDDRRSQALRLRIDAALAQHRRRVRRAETNGDEQAFPSLVAGPRARKPAS